MMKTLVFFRRSPGEYGSGLPHYTFSVRRTETVLEHGSTDAPVRIVPAGDEERLDIEEEEIDLDQINTARIAVQFFGLGVNDVDSDNLWWLSAVSGDCEGG